MMAKNKVSTLGTLHDLFLTNPNYGIREFTSALYQFKPDVILSEVLTENPNAGDASIDGGIEQAIVYAYAKEHKIPVLATDWFDGDLIREMVKEDSKVTPELIETLQTMSAFRKTFQNSSLLELNSESIQDHTREIYKIFEENGLLASRKRNDQIIKNVQNELSQFTGKRVLIIYGMDHKFFIDDYLKTMSTVEVLAVDTWYNPEVGKSFKVSDSLKYDTIENLKTSESMLKARLKNQTHIQELGEKFQAKLPKFQNWISSVSKL